MSGLSIVVIAAALTATAAGTEVQSQHQKELKEHYDHLAYIAEFNCHQPQPRVVSVHELSLKEDMTNKAFFPDVTVLHVCDNTVECCPSGHSCQPTQIQQLDLPFKITYLEQMGPHKKGSWEMKYYVLHNHTECQCLDNSVCHPAPEER